MLKKDIDSLLFADDKCTVCTNFSGVDREAHSEYLQGGRGFPRNSLSAQVLLSGDVGRPVLFRLSILIPLSVQVSGGHA